MAEPNFFVQNILPFFSAFGIIALIWNIYNYYQTQKGFLKLKLECSSQYDESELYIISKTSVENTGRRPIYIDNALLFMFKHNRDFTEALEFLDDEIKKKEKEEEKGEEKRENKVLTNKRIEFLERNYNVLTDEKKDFIITLLPYYLMQNRLGSLEVFYYTTIER